MNNRFLVRGQRLDNGKTVEGYLTKGWHFIYESQTHELVPSIEYEDKEKCVMVSHYVDPATVEPVAAKVKYHPEDKSIAYCPNCNLKIGYLREKDYCADCGQRLDWRGEDVEREQCGINKYVEDCESCGFCDREPGKDGV